MKSKWAITTVLTVVALGLSWAIASEPLLAANIKIDEIGDESLNCNDDDHCNPLCKGSDPNCYEEPKPPATWPVTVNADGSFTPKNLTIKDGDTVEWILYNGYKDAIIPVKTDGGANVCEAYKPYDSTDPNEFTGPMPHAASGIFTLGPMKKYILDKSGNSINQSKGLVETKCDGPVVTAGNKSLCETGELYKTMDSTWQDPDIAGVFIRLDWKEVEPKQGEFNWDILDREIKQAIKHGKLYSLVFRAGPSETRGTPGWVFGLDYIPIQGTLKTPRADQAAKNFHSPLDGAKRLNFFDYTAEGHDPQCGWEIKSIGGPNDRAYRDAYFGLLRAVAAHLRGNNAWYRALAYIKPSGMNTFTDENWLPTNCDPGCPICNTRVWAESGYTPQALTDFYKEQMGVLAEEFPDKDMSYMLIQEGFPVVNNLGQYKQYEKQPGVTQLESTSKIDGVEVKTDPCKFLKKEYAKDTLPYETQQTECVLENGVNGKTRSRDGTPGTFDKTRFVVQHNGLHALCDGPGSADGDWSCKGREIKFPNYLVKRYEQTQVVGFQTMNPDPDPDETSNNDTSHVSSSKDLEMALQNGYCNTNAMFVEVYEEIFWEIQNNKIGDDRSVLVPDAAKSCEETDWKVTLKLTRSEDGNRRLKDWAVMFDQRRMDHVKKLGLPDPTKHRHTFHANKTRTFKYRHGSKCKTAEDIASVKVEPRYIVEPRQ